MGACGSTATDGGGAGPSTAGAAAGGSSSGAGRTSGTLGAAMLDAAFPGCAERGAVKSEVARATCTGAPPLDRGRYVDWALSACGTGDGAMTGTEGDAAGSAAAIGAGACVAAVAPGARGLESITKA